MSWKEKQRKQAIYPLINSGAACLDACGEVKDENGNPVMKQWWEMTEADQKAVMDATTWTRRTTDTSGARDFLPVS